MQKGTTKCLSNLSSRVYSGIAAVLKFAKTFCNFQTACGSFRLNFWIFRVQSQDFNSMPQSKNPMVQQTNRFCLAHQFHGLSACEQFFDVTCPSALARLIFQNCLCKHLHAYLQVAKLRSAMPGLPRSSNQNCFVKFRGVWQ